MIKKIKLSMPHLLLLFSLLGIALTILFPYSSYMQIGVVVSFVIIYISFSLLHHYFDKSLTTDIVLEYILVASLVLLIILKTIAY